MPKTYIIWGEMPEEGTRPTEYSFETDAELNAFLLGIDESQGWMDYTVCDSADCVVGEFGEVVDLDEQNWVEEVRRLAKLRYHAGPELEEYLQVTKDDLAVPPEQWVDDWANTLGLTPVEA